MRFIAMTRGHLAPALAGLLMILTATAGKAQAQQGRPTPSVSVSVVTDTPLVEHRRYTGMLRSPSQVSLVARVSGELEETGFSEGDIVQAGQLLYRLDDVRYDAAVKAAEANIERCQASLKYAESNYARIKNLYDKNVTTLDAFESADMTLGTSRANLHSAQAALITARDDLKNTRITAPIGGKISMTNYTVGNYLTPSSGTLATIVSLDPLRLSFAISNRDFMDLFGGSEALFRSHAVIQVVLANGEVYPEKGEFEFRDNQVNRTTDTIPFHVRIPNPDHRLMPGSAVTVLLQRNDENRIASIPQTAVISDNRSSYVYIIDDQGIARRRDIVLGPSDGKSQLVRSGLKPGQTVISDGWHKVIPGQPVKPANDGR